MANWTDERVDQLKALWQEGWSASQIASRLGGVSRNAVIAKVHRSGFAGRTTQKAKTGGRPYSRNPRQIGVSQPSRPSKARVSAKDIAHRQEMRSEAKRPRRPSLSSRLPAESKAPSALRIKLTELTESMCRWPIGDPRHEDFHFCGNRQFAEFSYCEYHCRVSYNPRSL